MPVMAGWCYFNTSNVTIQHKKFPKLKELYKQLLSDKKTLFIDMIESDEEAIERLHNFEEEFMPFVSGEAFNSFYNDLYASGGTGVYVKNDVSLTSLSVMIFSKWNEINDMLIDRYDSSYTGKKKKYEDKYIEERKKHLLIVESCIFIIFLVLTVYCQNL